MNSFNYLPDVRQQYEGYPYPPRDPKREKERLLASITECFDYLNHYGFFGRRDFRKDFRALVAGGGTGDSVTLLAEQLRDSDTEIVYIDISEASINVAKERATVRGLDNIEWHQASLLDLPTLGFGEFDYINCSGVLHHLEDPDAGLAALNSVLKDDGIMGLMVYGQYGRTGVYHMQELMRLISRNDPIEERIIDCKKVLERLPKTNWLQHNCKLFNDLSFGDVGIYDLLLHSQDRAYTIPELYDFVEAQGLNILKMVDTQHYSPAHYIKDDALLEKISQHDTVTQYAIGELLAGTLKTHTCYVSRQAKKEPSLDDLDMVPCLPINTDISIYEQLYTLAKNATSKVTFKAAEAKVTIPISRELVACLKYMDGSRTIKEIYQKAGATNNIKRSALQRVFSDFYQLLAANELIFLRHKDIPRYQTVSELQQRVVG